MSKPKPEKSAFRFTNAALCVRTETRAQKLVLLVIAIAMNSKSEFCFLTYEYLMHHAQIASRGTVYKIIVYLRDTLVCLTWEEGNSQKANEYRFIYKVLVELAKKGNAEYEKGQLIPPGDGSTDSPRNQLQPASEEVNSTLSGLQPILFDDPTDSFDEPNCSISGPQLIPPGITNYVELRQEPTASKSNCGELRGTDPASCAPLEKDSPVSSSDVHPSPADQAESDAVPSVPLVLQVPLIGQGDWLVALERSDATGKTDVGLFRGELPQAPGFTRTPLKRFLTKPEALNYAERYEADHQLNNKETI